MKSLPVKRYVLPVLFCFCAILAEGQEWKQEAVSRDAAIASLEKTLQGRKTTTISAVVASTKERDVDFGTHCTGSSNGTVNGQVDENGNVTGNVTTRGSSSCRDVHNYFYTVVFTIGETPTSFYQLTAQCDVRWSWNHCTLPVEGDKDQVVLTREKKEHYAIYLALSKGTFDKKPAVSKYAIVDMKRFTKEAPPSQP
jgi:hypothetical protein